MNRARASVVATAAMLLVLTGCSSAGTDQDGPAASPVPQEVWRWTAPPPAYVGMPAADGAGTAFTSALSRLVMLDTQGRQSWVAEHRRLRDVAPWLDGEQVVAATEHGLVAFDRVDGRQRWSSALGERTNTPAPVGGLLLASTWDGSLAAIEASSGQLRWRAALPGPARGPAVGGADVAVTSWESSDHSHAGVIAFDLVDGQLRWHVPLPPGGVSAPASVRSGEVEMVVVVAGDRTARGLAAGNGSEGWRTALEGAGSPEVPPVATGAGDVLVGHRLGGLALLSAGDGHNRWQVSSDGAAVRGAPTGPSPGGRFALPLDDGRVLLAGPGQPTVIIDPPGRVSGVATGPERLLVVATREAPENGVTAASGW